MGGDEVRDADTWHDESGSVLLGGVHEFSCVQDV